MMSNCQSVLIAHLLGEKNLALLDALGTKADICKHQINEKFRLFDLMGLLSYRYITDSVLTCYVHYLSAHTSKEYFVSPLLYKWMEDFSTEKLSFKPDWLLGWCGCLSTLSCN